MIFTRKLGKIFRGKATPSQLMMAAIIGTTAGFMPGLLQAPGLLVLLFLAAVILNANLALMGICLLLAALLSFPLLPVTFRVGQFLLEGPLEGFFAAVINAPVLALFGFEYYITTGGLVVGVVVGSLFGWGTVRAVQGFRRKMAALDKDSEKWQRFQQRGLVKLFVLVFIGGGHGKLTYEELLAQKGNTFRPLGLVFAGLMLVTGFVVALFASDAIVGYALQSGLERANGATVDLEKAELELGEGRLRVSGLALADPHALDTDLFRAASIEANISQADLLRKRMHIEQLRVVDASSGEKRVHPGILYRPLPEAPPPAPEDEEEDVKSFDDYVREAEKWRERLDQVADWLERLSGPEETAEKSAEKPADPEATDEGTRMRRILEDGYRHAVASHLVRGAPTLLISEASAEKMRVKQLPEETLDVSAENLSTHPALVDGAPRLTIRSSDETLVMDAEMGAFSSVAGSNVLELVYRGLPVNEVASELKFSGEAPVEGGTLDFHANGSWTASTLDLPVEVTLRNTQLSLPEAGPVPVEELMLPIGVSGSFRHPRIHFSDEAFADALAAAGKAELSRRVRGEADKLREKAEEKMGEELRERTRGFLDGKFPGQ